MKKNKILNKKETERFLRNQFKAFCMPKVGTKIFDRLLNSITVQLISDGNAVAYTDFNKICISQKGEFLTKYIEFSQRKNMPFNKHPRIVYMLGLLCHESGHILYTAPINGQISPYEHNVMNIMEDAYIEKRMLGNSSGLLIKCLEVIRAFQLIDFIEDRKDEELDEIYEKFSTDKSQVEDELKLGNFLNDLLIKGKYDKSFKNSLVSLFLENEDYNNLYLSCFSREGRADNQKELAKAILEFLEISDISKMKQQQVVSDDISNLNSIDDNVRNEASKEPLNDGEKRAKEISLETKEERLDADSSDNYGASNQEESTDNDHSKKAAKSSEESTDADDSKKGDKSSKESKEEALNDESKKSKEDAEDAINKLNGEINRILNKEDKEFIETFYQTVLLYDKSIEETELNKEKVNNFISEKRKEIKLLERGLRNFVDPNEDPITLKKEYSGKIDRNAGFGIVQDSMSVFNKTLAPTAGDDLSVIIMLDESGSMTNAEFTSEGKSTRHEEGVKAVIMFSEALRRNGIYHEIYGHSTIYDSEEYCVIRRYSSLSKLYSLTYDDMHNNIDIEALKFCYDRAKKFNTSKTMILFISDGQPAGRNYGSAKDINEYMELIKRDSKSNCILFGCGIGSARDSVNKLFTKTILVDEISKIPKKAVSRVKKLLK